MYTLYYMSGACSLAIHVVLNELGQQLKLENVRVPEGQPRNPEFLKINPRGQVPVLVEEDGNPIREGGAIIAYLLDKHHSPMMPKSGKARAKALEWLMFANATLHPAYGRVFFTMRNVSDQKAKEEMAQLQAKNEDLLKEAKEERNIMLLEAKNIATKIVEDSREKAKAEYEKLIEHARNDFETEKIAALMQMKNEAGKLAVDIAEKLIRKELADKKAQEDLVTSLINEAKLN